MIFYLNKDMIKVGNKSFKEDGYCKLVRLFESLVYTSTHPFGIKTFSIGFHTLDRELSVKLRDYLKVLNLNGCNNILMYETSSDMFFKNISKNILYCDKIVDNLNYDPKKVNHKASIFLQIFDESLDYNYYLEILKVIKLFFIENNIKVLVENPLTIRWDLETIGRYLNNSLLSNFITKQNFEINLFDL